MFDIRKFVGCFKVAAICSGVFVLMLTGEPASAAPIPSWSVDWSRATQQTTTQVPAPSPACLAAIQAIKTAFANDRAEDAAERAQQALEPDAAADQAEDAAERAQFRALFVAAHSACAATIAAVIKSHTTTTVHSAQCTAALQALKAEIRALWTQGTRPTSAQLTHLRSLKDAARAACGWTSPTWTWSGSWSWHRR